MNTPSHFLIAAALKKRNKQIPIISSAFLLGSVAPDLPLFGLSIGAGIYYTQVKGMAARDVANNMFGDLFFNDPWWIALHNFLHSPTLLLLFLIPLWFVWKQKRIFAWFWWFFLSCLLHTAVDIPTHHDDGPLLFFPFEWSTRFQSPVSYWDPKHYGNIFVWFEGALGIFLLAYLLVPWFKRRLAKRKHVSPDVSA